jgi:hypothetical protein
MTPLFINTIGTFIRKTKGWWIGLAIVVAVLAVIAFAVWTVIIGWGYWLIIVGIVGFMFLLDV